MISIFWYWRVDAIILIPFMMIAKDNFYVMEDVIFTLGVSIYMASVMVFLQKKMYSLQKLFHTFHQMELKLIKLQQEDREVLPLLTKVMMCMNGVPLKVSNHNFINFILCP